MVKPILKYPGAKWLLADWIVSYLPKTTHYVEPYFGSGAVFFSKDKAPHELINDLSGDVCNVFRVVRTRGEELAQAVELTPYARQEYYDSYEACDDELEQARRFFVRCWQSHGFKPYCRTGWRNNGSKSLQPVTRLWNDVPNRIRATILRLKDAEIENLPALAIIGRYATADTLIYADPPYVLSTRKGRKLYSHEMTDADHIDLLEALNAHPGPVALSGYDSTLYAEHLAGWRKVTTQATSEKGGARTEVLWLNSALNDMLDYGPLFRA